MSQKTLKYCFLKVPLQVLAIPLEVPQQGHPKVHPAPCQRTRDHGGCLTGRADASLLALTWWCVYCVYCDAVSIESTESAEKTEKLPGLSGILYRKTANQSEQSSSFEKVNSCEPSTDFLCLPKPVIVSKA